MKSYRERIKELREDNDLTQTDVAKLLNCSQTAYGKYELGKRDMKIEDLILLAKYYSVSMDYITGVTDEINKTWNRVQNTNNITNVSGDNTGTIVNGTINGNINTN